jgi:hypothetical protein
MNPCHEMSSFLENEKIAVASENNGGGFSGKVTNA